MTAPTPPASALVRPFTVSISDAEGLKKVSCECYQTITEKARELLDDPSFPSARIA